MLASITPLGERGKGNRWGVTATAHVVGSVVGGALGGTALGLIGQGLRALLGHRPSTTVVALLLLTIIAAIGIVFDLGVAGSRLPSIRHQVDERWLDEYRGWVYGVGFGFQLGLGWVTIVTASATYVALAAALLSGSWIGGLLVGAAFGLVRGGTVFATARVHTPAALVALHRQLAASAASTRTWVLVGQALVGVGALVAAVVVLT